ncbi:MAG: aminomethyl-transferring glycine dehydrogenase subunit GcvPB [Candidatus Cloacimonetes bacterium]|nr:aminomethyl-transferring glycine dehydrogenase subunit GcvPB [Candidatus Cloacimonadota bacterium]
MAKTIFEKHTQGRRAVILPQNDVDVKVCDIIPEKYLRKQPIRIPEVSELDVMRHFIELSSLNHFIEKGFYPLGSCTMKYNPKMNETLVRNTGLSNLHPHQPEDTVQGALEILYELQNDLAEISGMEKVTLQPVAGAHGEFTGIKIVHAYHKAKGNNHKNKIILPDSAHGTNPATVALNGYEVIEIASNSDGKVDIEALRKVCDDSVAGFMLTNPNTLGIFESQICEIAEIIHSVDGLLYMDGANLNALLGIVKPGKIGFDIMHFNLHKTFATPHGGGGPGSGPVGVRKDLVKFLPVPMVEKKDNTYFLDYSHKETSIGKIHSFYGNFAVNVRAYIYIKTLGADGLRGISENAIINANYLLRKLEKYFYVKFNQNCMHEFVASGEWQKEKYGVKTLDIAKRLLDKGFHAPTIYFPLIIHEAMMIEPTETESKDTLDEFIKAMIEISEEIEKDPEILKNAPCCTPVKRVDDTKAVRDLDVKFNIAE